MKTGLTELVFIIDRSGSMSGLEEDTIGGFNSMLKQQKNVDGEAYVIIRQIISSCLWQIIWSYNQYLRV